MGEGVRGGGEDTEKEIKNFNGARGKCYTNQLRSAEIIDELSSRLVINLTERLKLMRPHRALCVHARSLSMCCRVACIISCGASKERMSFRLQPTLKMQWLIL